MATAFLGFGSNLGDREANIRESLVRLSNHPDIRIGRISSIYETAPVGLTDQPDFLNAVVSIETGLDPLQLLKAVLDVEHDMGRERTIRWGPRVIDLDVLLYGDEVVDTPELTVPHPRMIERAFVIAPLAEIAPDLKLPNGRTPVDVLNGLGDQQVTKVSER